jgi:hypothetical protein
LKPITGIKMTNKNTAAIIKLQALAKAEDCVFRDSGKQGTERVFAVFSQDGERMSKDFPLAVWIADHL